MSVTDTDPASSGGPRPTYYVICCRICDPEMTEPIPYPNPAERGAWATAHTEATGHDRWLVVEVRP